MNLQAFYPEKAYPQLYRDVMMLQIFADSKTFADAIPLASPEEIDALYKKIDRPDEQQIIEFVHQWFQLPETPVEFKSKAKPIEQHISDLWKILSRKPNNETKLSSLISLPFPYIVPGGRFREIYYWDSYFTMLGLQADERIDIIQDMIRNFAWQLDHIGHVPNGNRSYFLSRSQPPFFSLMVELLSDILGPDIYNKYLPQLLTEYSFWMNGQPHDDKFRRIVKLPDGRYLNRYYDDEDLPRAESYAEDQKLYDETVGEKMNLFRNLRAACESGWDFSSRWFARENDLASIQTINIIPVDLNSLLFLLEKIIAKSYRHQQNEAITKLFEKKSDQRADSINQYLWNNDRGIYCDYNYNDGTSGIPSLAMMYPLFAGIASPTQAERVIEFVSKHFLRPGGWVTTNQFTGQQWDAPNGWAPLQWITYIGLKKYGAIDLAIDGAKRWLSLIEEVYNRTGRMMEKYNVEDLSLEAGGGEYPVQDGFGWTNGVYLGLSREIKKT